ncbi:hypothetical protein KM043_009747 [Ampulex compressa]|nr:hypothetical protein KM043_009747 [Ampulex compressa]
MFISTCNIFTISTILVGYLIILYIYWTPNNFTCFRYMSFVIWLMISMYVSNALGSYQVIAFVTLQTLCLVGFIYEVVLIMESQEMEGKQLTFTEAARFSLTNKLLTDIHKHNVMPLEKDKPTESSTSSISTNVARSMTEPLKGVTSPTVESSVPTVKLSKQAMSLDADVGISSKTAHKMRPTLVSSAQMSLRDRYLLRKLKTELHMSVDIEGDSVGTDKYMYGALYACLGMLLWKHRWIVYIFVIPIVYYIIKQLGNYFGVWKVIHKRCYLIMETIKSWCMERHEALLPANVRGLYKVYIIVDKKMTQLLKGSVDAVATTAVILGLLVFTASASIFITVQIYAEGTHLIQVTGEILNSSLMNNPDIDWLPEKWEDSVNSVLDNAYTYGRGAISDGIRGLVKDLEPAKAEQIEKKVLELWDRLYQAWMMSNENPNLIGPTVDVMAAYSVWESFKDSIGKTPLQLFNMTNIQNFVKENIGIFMSVLDSIWSIVKGNMSVILTIFTELFYIILMSGSAVLNFVLSMVVFFTTLFYLLSSSNKTYKPIELTTLFSPISCHKFAIALQEAVIGVFAATFKLASFFGMWTWFIHNMFQVKIVYLPSAFATVLGAVPFLDAYFACVPATVELWFTSGPMVAILFFMFHFLPCNIVVTEFYKEIKGGGHPYLTGLSIAGGIFCLGVEGAIFGPLLLCCIMVAINLSRRYLHSPSEEVIGAYGRITH